MQPNSPTKRYVDKEELISRLRTEKKRYFYWNPQSEAIQNAIDIVTLTDDVCEYSISKSVLKEYVNENYVHDTIVYSEHQRIADWLEGKIKR